MVNTLFIQYVRALTGQDFFFVLISIAIGLIVGYLVEKTILRLIGKILSYIPREIGTSFVKSLKYLLIFWGMVLGAYFSLKEIGMGPRVTFFVREFLVGGGVVTGGLVLSRFLSFRIKYKATESNHVLVSTTIFSNIVKLLVLFISVLIALQILNVPIGPALTALGVGGIAVALALKDTLENFFGGLQLILSRQVRIGNYIMLPTGEEGYVRDITWRNTSIETPGDTTLIIPNSKLSNAYVTNCSVPDEAIAVTVKFIVSPYAQTQFVEKITNLVANDIQNNSSAKSLKDYTPIIRMRELNQFGQEWSAKLLAKNADIAGKIRHDFLVSLVKQFQEEKVPLVPASEDRVYVSRNDNKPL